MSKKIGQIVIILAYCVICFIAGWWATELVKILKINTPEQYTTITSYDAEVTAYCPCEICCGEWADGITASGSKAEGFFVAAPPSLPFSTLVQIPGYNQGYPIPVLDRGGAIKRNRIDVFFSSHQEALNWGRQYLEVRVLEGVK